jgi:hypothetical protein
LFTENFRISFDRPMGGASSSSENVTMDSPSDKKVTMEGENKGKEPSFEQIMKGK